MEMNFYMPVRIITGTNCISENARELLPLGKKCLVVTGKSSAKKCGALDEVISALDSIKTQYTIFDEIKQNPSYESCKKAGLLAKELGAQYIIGIGGGSPLDAAKAVAVVASNPDIDEKTLFSMSWSNKPLPIVAVGTTAGTGSEVTSVSVLTATDGLKKSFRSPDTFPTISFGDAKYTLSLDGDFTRSTALDALSHCIESYFNKATNEICRAFAIKGVKILVEMLEMTADCEKAPLSLEQRQKLYCASIYGGLAISVAGTAFPHAFGYFLSEQYNVAHGNACAIYLEEFLSYNQLNAPNEFEKFFAEAGTTKEQLCRLIKKNLPKICVSLTPQQIEMLLPRYQNNKSLLKCYGNADTAFARELLTRFFGFEHF